MGTAAARETAITGELQGSLPVRLLGRAVAGLLGALSFAFAVLPEGVAYAAGSALGAAIYAIARWRESRLNRRAKPRGTLRNIRIAFRRDLSPREVRRLAWRASRHVGWLVVEFLRLRLVTRRRLERLVDARDLEVLRRLEAEGRSVICVSGHIGSWELCSYASSLAGLRVSALSRPTPLPGVQLWLHRQRSRAPQKVISKFGGMWALRKALKRGEHVGIVADENVREGAVFVPFFGAWASANPSLPQLQRSTGAPIAVLTCNRVARGRFRIHVWRVIEPDRSAPRQAEQRRVLTEVAAALEEAIRTYPEQWLWSLRRWETRPPGEALGADGLPPEIVDASNPPGARPS